MATFGAPSSLPGSTFETLFIEGFGDPSEFDGSEYDYHGAGFGDPPSGFTSADADPPSPPSFAFLPTVTTGEFGDDGGALVELYAPRGTFPGRGPYLVRLVDADGNLWPPTSEPACYSARASGGDECLASRSLERLRFALPVVPQGAYGIRLEWDEGVSQATLNDILLVVPADVVLETLWLGRAFA